MRVSERDIAAVQRCYPKIYLACHTRHQRRRTNAAALTAHESSLLAHLSEQSGMRPSALAAHLGIGRPALSAAIKRLTALGYVTQSRDDDDARAVALRLSAKGARAMQASSVLDAARVKALLDVLSPDDRASALQGLELLARAATALGPRERPNA